MNKISQIRHFNTKCDSGPVLLSRRSRQRERLSATMLSICSSVCLSPECKTRFSQKLSTLELWCLLTTYRKSYALLKEPIIGSLKSKMAEIAIWKVDMTSFFCRGWSDLDKISETGAEWHVDCGDVVDIETRCRIPNMADFGANSMAYHPKATYHIAGWIHYHDSRATCHIAGCKNSIRRIENRFSPYFIIFVFNAV